MNNLPKLICLGSAAWDYIACTDLKMEKEFDVPGLIIKQPGGVATNIAIGLSNAMKHKHIFEIILLAAIGLDIESKQLMKNLQSLSINCDYLTKQDGPSDRYIVIESKGEMFGAVADTSQLSRAAEKILLPLVNGEIIDLDNPCEHYVILDGNLSQITLDSVFTHQAFQKQNIIVTSASPTKARTLRKYIKSKPHSCYLNLKEAEAIADKKFSDSREAAEYIFTLGANRVVITNGNKSVSSLSNKGFASLKPETLRGVTSTGAGDIFSATHIISTLVNPELDPVKHLEKAELETRTKIRSTMKMETKV